MTHPMPAESELLPCPFCGDKGIPDAYQGPSGNYYTHIECQDCTNVWGSVCNDPNPDIALSQAIFAWNTRTPTTSPVSAEDVRAALSRIENVVLHVATFLLKPNGSPEYTERTAYQITEDFKTIRTILKRLIGEK